MTSSEYQPAGSKTKTAQYLALVDEHIDTQDTPEFRRLKEWLASVKVCTSLDDEAATERINLVPPNLLRRWQLSIDEHEQSNVCNCDQPLATHRHLIFEC